MGNSLTGIADIKANWKVYVDLGTGVEYNINSNEEEYIIKNTGLINKMTYQVNQNIGEMTYIGKNEQILAGLDGNLFTLRNILTVMLKKLAPIAKVEISDTPLVLAEKEKWRVVVDLGTGVVYTIVSTEDKYIVKVTGYEQKMVYHVVPTTGAMVFVQAEYEDEEIEAGTDGNLQSLRDVLKVLISKIVPLSNGLYVKCDIPEEKK